MSVIELKIGLDRTLDGNGIFLDLPEELNDLEILGLLDLARDMVLNGGDEDDGALKKLIG